MEQPSVATWIDEEVYRQMSRVLDAETRKILEKPPWFLDSLPQPPTSLWRRCVRKLGNLWTRVWYVECCCGSLVRRFF